MAHMLVKILFLLFIMPYNIKGIEVHIHDNLPPNTPKLVVRCQSGDDDLGVQSLGTGDDYKFSFGFKLTTLFFCHFSWNGKDVSFDVFNDIGYCVHDGKKFVPLFTKSCYWVVQVDGFYLGHSDNGKIVADKYRDW
ncbi:hypothetical protein FXO38_19863 [Capsicum annuum]|uniref:S-protein homolog n=1 Tax=Capsicum annuum TaxID=4072 RepID=A0A1U8GH33_CAPAN|nr:hypothetical protein FXO38_19863 [Capsicum annuum]KAF3648134.1 hypothetical protein FXO37_19598 [Capsicum annuum]PHT61261.1 hypothetical protein T459_34893 [Capsicum annuum]